MTSSDKGIHSFADMYSCMELEAVARRYIYQHFLEVMKQDEFMQLPEEKLVEILKSDRLQVNQEEQVYQAAVSWIKYARVYLNADPETSCRVFQNVRLPLLDSRFLEEKVTQQDFVRNCMKCQNLVANAVRTKGDNNALATISPRAQPQGIFVVGGRNSIDCQLKSMERYDSLKDQWVPMGSMSIARTAVGAATLNGIIYAVGGECALAQSQDETIYLRCVEAYDPIVKDWYTCADMKVPRSFVAVCAAGRYLYALGGEDRLNSYNIAERYCYKTNTWTFIPNMQRKRAGAGITVCDSKIYIAGGYDKSFHTDRASVECYDPDTQEWSFVAEMEKARSGLALVALDHYLYAFGGRSRHNDQYFDSAERYNTWTHQWTSIATLSTPRAWPSAVAMDNHIYVLGGFDGSNRLRSVELYDPESDTWAYINSMNVSRAGGAATVL